MVIFILLAGVLTTAAVLLIAVPLIRGGAEKSPPASWAAIAAALVIVIGAALCYVLSSNWTWHVVEGNQPQDMVARLARRLKHNPNDLQGWLMLGQSYEVLQQLPLAVRAYERANRLAGGKNVDAIVGLAGELALADPAELDGRAGRLIEQAIRMEPNSGKAVFYGAAAALRRGELPLARERFARLLTLDPPANVRPILQQEIDAIDQTLAGGGSASATPGAAAPAPGGRPPRRSAPIRCGRQRAAQCETCSGNRCARRRVRSALCHRTRREEAGTSACRETPSEPLPAAR